jgi:hypothetical protein
MLQFAQHEIEEAINDILKHADRIDIARITGIYKGVVEGMFNPNDERKSAIYIALQIICALDEIDETRGDALFQKIIEFRELSKIRRPANVKSLKTETGKLNCEFAEFIAAHLEGKPFDKQFAEFMQIEAQLAVVKKGLLDEYNALKNKPRELSLKIVSNGNK